MSTPSTKFVFFGPTGKKDGRPGLWLAETFSTSPLKWLNGIQPNLTGSKISTLSTKFVFFGPIRKTRWPSWPLIGWDIFYFSETAERNSTTLDRKQDLNALYQVCVFRADRKNKMAALASDWLRHFQLLLWNHWPEFDKTWQEARSQPPLPSLCFSGWSKNKTAILASDWLRHFRLLLYSRWMEFNETWQEARSQHLLPSLYFSGPIGKTRWPPWLLIGWDIFDFFSETAEGNSTKLDRKQDLNVTNQVCIFWADRKNKMAAPASDYLRHFRLKPLNRIRRNLIWSKISTFFTKFVFLGPIGKKKMTALASDWLRHFWLLLSNRWTEFNKTWQEANS